jgi:hypothetical protein
MVASQIKYWLFALVGAIGVYIALTGLGMTEHLALGLSMVGGMITAMILSGVWDAIKSGETAATYQRETRDEKARQEYHAMKAGGAKQLDAPKRKDPTNEQGG